MRTGQNRTGLWIALSIIAIIAAALIYFLLINRGTAKLIVFPGDAVVQVDGASTPVTIKNNQLQIQLRAGQHHVDAQKTGYIKFSRDFTIKRGQTATVNVYLAPTSQDVFYTAMSGYLTSVSPSQKLTPRADYTLTSPVYLVDNTWAVSRLTFRQVNSQGAIVVFDRDGDTWNVSTLGTDFDQSLRGTVPDDVYNYVINQL